jgi:hypothetical protein
MPSNETLATSSNWTLDVLLSYLYITEVLMYEIAFLPQGAPASRSNFNFKRLEYLNACLQSAKSSLDVFLSFEPLQYVGMSFPIILHFSYSIQILYRLSILEDPEWDRDVVRSTADVIWYLEQVAVKMGEVNEALRLEYIGMGTTSFARGAEAIRATIPLWNSVLERNANGPTTSPQGAAQGGDGFPDTGPANLSDDSWFMDIFASWD